MFLDTTTLFDSRIKLVLFETHERDLKKDWSASYVFKVQLLDGTKIGHCDLRLDHLDSIYIAGNIGYEIDERFWNQNYATDSVKLLIKLAKMHEMEYVTITCQENNFASNKVAKKCGFKFIEKTSIPKRHQMYLEGLREVMIYQLVL